jgi:hypothetical protein
MGALVTTFAINAPPSPMSFCGLLRWCHTADWIVTNVMPGLDVIIFTDAHDIVRRECPKARILPFDNTLVHVVTRWSKRNHGNKHRMQAEPGSSCPANTLLKWEVVNPRHYPENTGVIMYLDSDVDARWCTSVEELERFHFKQKLAEFAADASCALRATPDHQAPVNTGIMLLKPSYKMYREGLAMLRTRSFNLQTGFNETGPPKWALNTTARAEREVAKARGYWANTWDFVCGDGDQGLFTTMYMARHQQFCVPRYWDKPLRVQHFWGGDKPWCVPRRAMLRAWALSCATPDPMSAVSRGASQDQRPDVREILCLPQTRRRRPPVGQPAESHLGQRHPELPRSTRTYRRQSETKEDAL